MSFVKLAARCLMISAMPFLLSALFFRSRLRRHTVPEHAHLAESAESSSLSGTQWQHIEYNTPAGTVHSTLSFSSSTFSLSIKQSKGTNQSYSGKYEYSGGSGTLYIDGDPAYISVSGYDLTLSWTGVRLDFTKKCGVIPYNDCGSGGGSAKVYDTKNKKWIN